MALQQWLEGPAGYGEPVPTIGADLALPLCYVSKSLSHPVRECVVFSLVTLVPGCSGQSV